MLRQILAALTLAWVVIAASLLFQPDTLVHDEPGFLAAANQLAPLYADGLTGGDGFSDPLWSESLSHYGSHNPKVGLYTLAAIDRITTRVAAQRLLMGTLAALTAALLFILAARTTSPTAGWCTLALLLASPAFRNVQAAMLPDLPMALFTAAALLVLAALHRRSHAPSRTVALLLLLGLLAGLAVSCKLYAAALAPVIPLALAHRVHERPTLLAGGLAAATVLALAVFVGTNPMLWHDPLDGLHHMTSGHLAVWGGSSSAFHTASLGTMALHTAYAWLPPGLVHGHALPFPLAWIMSAAVGWLLCAIGILLAARRRTWLPVLWFACSTLFLAWTVSRLHPSWILPKVFLLPNLGLVWAGGLALDAAADGLRARIGR